MRISTRKNQMNQHPKYIFWEGARRVFFLFSCIFGLPFLSAGELGFIEAADTSSTATPILPGTNDFVSLAENSNLEKPGTFYALDSGGRINWVLRIGDRWHAEFLQEGKFSSIKAFADGSGFLFALSGDAIYQVGWLGKWNTSKLVEGKYRAISSNYMEGQTAACYAVTEDGGIVLVGFDSNANCWAEVPVLSGDYIDIVQLPSEGHPIYALREDGGIDRVALSASDGKWRSRSVLDGKYQRLLCAGVDAARTESLLILNEKGESELVSFDGDTCQTSPVNVANIVAATAKPDKPPGYFVITSP